MVLRCNIDNFEKYRRSYSNALFNKHYRAFDEIFRLVDLVLHPNLFCPEAKDGIVYDEDYFTRFQFGKVFEKKEDFVAYLQKKRGGGKLGEYYFAYGKKGAGKTTCMQHFFVERLNDPSSKLFDPRALPIFLDLFGITEQEEKEIKATIWEKIYYYLQRTKEMRCYFEDPEIIINIVPTLKGASPIEITDWVAGKNIQTYAKRLLYYVSTRHRIYLILDNTDELGFEVIRTVIKTGYDLSVENPIRVIFVLRDYWQEVNLGVSSQLHMLHTHLDPPKIEQVISKRIDHLDLTTGGPFDIKFHKYEDGKRIPDEKRISLEDLRKFLKSIAEIFKYNVSIRADLYRMTNENVREILDNIYNFFHSCNLSLVPFFQSYILGREEKKRELLLEDFITCFMTIHSMCFDYGSSVIFNLFDMAGSCSAHGYKNTIGYLRLLQRIGLGEKQNLVDVIMDFEKLGYLYDKIIAGLETLFNNGLLESTKGTIEQFPEKIWLSEKGKFYIEQLVYTLNYLLYVQDRVPMPRDFMVPIEEKFGDPHAEVVGEGNWRKRSEAIEGFIKFISLQEDDEFNEFKKTREDVLIRVRGGTLQPISAPMLSVVSRKIKKINAAFKRKVPRITDMEISDIRPVFIQEEPSGDHGPVGHRVSHADLKV